MKIMYSYKNVEDLEKLLDKINAEIAKRVKELNCLKSLLYNDIEQKDYINTILRSNTLLLYSHWEGAIKNLSTKYLEYVFKVSKEYNFTDLKINFLSLAMMNDFSNIKQDNSFTNINKIINNIIDRFNSKVSLKIKEDIIKTNSNLNYKMLQNIILQLGIDNPISNENENLLDRKLVGSRNAIAHGQYESNINSIEDFEEIYKFVIEGIDLFKEEIINSAENKKYLKIE